jgi:hypothetical protein
MSGLLRPTSEMRQPATCHPILLHVYLGFVAFASGSPSFARQPPAICGARRALHACSSCQIWPVAADGLYAHQASGMTCIASVARHHLFGRRAADRSKRQSRLGMVKAEADPGAQPRPPLCLQRNRRPCLQRRHHHNIVISVDRIGSGRRVFLVLRRGGVARGVRR